jgi:hypothetical protein
VPALNRTGNLQDKRASAAFVPKFPTKNRFARSSRPRDTSTSRPDGGAGAGFPSRRASTSMSLTTGIATVLSPGMPPRWTPPFQRLKNLTAFSAAPRLKWVSASEPALP